MADETSDENAANRGRARRVIKKYPNRRLYDTRSSGYITLAQVREMVMQDEEFGVVDAKSGADLTRGVLLQILLDAEAGGVPMFSETVLAHMIRFYGHTFQGFMRPYLEKNIQAMAEMQATMAARADCMSPEGWTRFVREQSPVIRNAMNNYLEQSSATLLDLHERMRDHTQRMLEALTPQR